MDWKVVAATIKNRSVIQAGLVLGLDIVLPFYAAFVVQWLWGWFVANALHVEELSYWQTFGFMIFLYLVSTLLTRHFDKEARWERTRIVIAACVPEEKQASVAKAVQKAERYEFLYGS